MSCQNSGKITLGSNLPQGNYYAAAVWIFATLLQENFDWVNSCVVISLVCEKSLQPIYIYIVSLIFKIVNLFELSI